MGGDSFLLLANHTLEEAMLKAGFSQSFLNEMVAPITRVNYGQSVRINGFVGTAKGLESTNVQSNVRKWQWENMHYK